MNRTKESARLEHMARVLATAQEVWGNETDVREFMLSPNPQLDDERPFDVALTELGARRVESLLWALHHGLPI